MWIRWPRTAPGCSVRIGPNRPEPTGSWTRGCTAHVRHLAEDLASEDNLAEHAMATSTIEHVVMTGLLSAQGHNYADALARKARSPGPQQVRRAIELIEDGPDAVSSVAELARRVGASARALQAGFRRHLDTTPG